MANDPQHHVTEFDKNSQSSVRLTLTSFHGHRLVDARVYADAKGVDVRVPTKAGLAIRVEQIETLMAALQEARLMAVSMGWLSTGDGI